MQFKFFTIAVLAMLLAFSCGSDDDNGRPQSEIDRDLILDYLAENGINAQEDPSGMFFEIINAGGADRATLATQITAAYKGYYLDGEVFDEASEDDPLMFPLGNLIQGWQIGLQKIGRGGRMNMYIPSALGYGAFPPEGVRANAVLVFEMHLMTF